MDPRTMIVGLLLVFVIFRVSTTQEPTALLWFTIGMAIGLFLDRLILVPISTWLEQHERPPRR